MTHTCAIPWAKVKGGGWTYRKLRSDFAGCLRWRHCLPGEAEGLSSACSGWSAAHVCVSEVGKEDEQEGKTHGRVLSASDIAGLDSPIGDADAAPIRRLGTNVSRGSAAQGRPAGQ